MKFHEGSRAAALYPMAYGHKSTFHIGKGDKGTVVEVHSNRATGRIRWDKYDYTAKDNVAEHVVYLANIELIHHRLPEELFDI